MKILVLREEGLGNSLQSVPMYASIKKNIPDVILDVWISPRAYDLMIDHPLIDHLFKWPKVPTNSIYDYGIVALFNGGLMIESAKKICKKLLFHPKVDYKNKSETLHNLEILKQINGWDGKFYPNSLYVSEYDSNFAKELFKALRKPTIALGIGCEISVPVHKKRLWTLGGWVKLIKLLQDKYNPTFLFLGGKNEESLAKEICERLPNWYSIHNLVCQTAIKQTAAILRECDLLVAIDCGLIHIASVFGTKQIVLFGPTSEIKSQIWTSKDKYAIVRNHVSCELCYTRAPQLFQQCKNQICMTGIQPEQILNAIEEKKFL